MRGTDERTADLPEIIRAAGEAFGAGLRVAMPGIIDSWDASSQTATVQLSVREKVISDGKEENMEIPLLVDVPVVMPRAGGYILAFAPKKGDEVLVVFADLCIDAWWQSGDVQNQDEIRRHDLSDAFAIFGCWSQVRKPKLPSSGVFLQNDSGTAGISIIGSTVNLFGSVTINGSSYTAHRHSGVEAGSSNTGRVV